MAEATEAKDTLLDPGKRRLYNQYLGSEATPRFEPPNQNLHSESAPTDSASHRDGPDGWLKTTSARTLTTQDERSGKLLTIAILFAVFTYYDWAHSVPGLTGVPYRERVAGIGCHLGTVLGHAQAHRRPRVQLRMLAG